MLNLKNVVKKFNEKIVFKNLNCEFRSGLNFIMGPSGSGKSTLLKILSGIDRDYEGKVLMRGKDLKLFTETELNEYYYNSVGFIWQDFKLIDHLSVEDNIKIALELDCLSESVKEKKISEVLRQLSISNLAKKNVSKLSGGQKQRVAIARAIVKNPEIIIADEPTGALDKKTSETIMSILRNLSKERLVIIVTHDKSVVSEDGNCFELRKGILNQVSIGENSSKESPKKNYINPKLKIGGAGRLGVKNLKGMALRFLAVSLILAISSYLLLLNVNKTVSSESEGIFQKLVEERGESIKDITVVSSAIGGSSTSGNGDKTSLNIKQDVSKVLEDYKDDERIESLRLETVINDMDVTIDGMINGYSVENSNSSPILKSVIEGRMPKLEGREIAINQEFLKKSGLKAKDVIGKKINIQGKIFDWSTGEPKEVNVSVKDADIVGVVDSTCRFDYQDGSSIEMAFEDSFFYSLDIAKEIKGNPKSNKDMSFTIRVKNIEDTLKIVEELQSKGITPLGQFEEVRDILSMSKDTKNQSSSITIIMGLLAIITTLITTIINSYLRKEEFGILRINAYSKWSIFKISLVEYLMIAIIASIILVVLFPVISNLSQSIISIVLSKEAIFKGVLIIVIQAIVMSIVSSIIYGTMKIEKNLMGSKR